MSQDLGLPSHWTDVRVLGRGTFNTVYSAFDSSLALPIAIKIPKDVVSSLLLAKETEILRTLKGCRSVPRLLECREHRNCIVMERVGKTLLDLHEKLKRLSLKTIAMIAIKAISALEEIHDCGFIHRDVKPDNMSVALNASDSRLYFLDMGFSCRYTSNGVHLPYSENNKFQGSPFFCSSSTLRRVKPSRRDDLEALGYVLVFLCRGGLPWYDPSILNSMSEITRVREATSIPTLCSALDPEFAVYIQKCQQYSFSEKPNYEDLRGLFATLAERNQFQLDWKYDWTPKPKRIRLSEGSYQRLSQPKAVSTRISERKGLSNVRSEQPEKDKPVHRRDQLSDFPSGREEFLTAGADS